MSRLLRSQKWYILPTLILVFAFVVEFPQLCESFEFFELNNRGTNNYVFRLIYNEEDYI